VTVRRITPDISAADPRAGRAFYEDVLGMRVAMDLGWVVNYASKSNPTAQIIVINPAEGTPHTDYSVEVDDVDAVHARAKAAGLDIVYALRTEPWNVRRFFVRDPHGKIANILSHVAPHQDEETGDF
jgi:catechol 2,3-dioxygenase-like lactoylglutathione lyase family enzyme